MARWLKQFMPRILDWPRLKGVPKPAMKMRNELLSVRKEKDSQMEDSTKK